MHQAVQIFSELRVSRVWRWEVQSPFPSQGSLKRLKALIDIDTGISEIAAPIDVDTGISQVTQY